MPRLNTLTGDLFPELERKFKPVRETESGFQLAPPDRRLSWGIAKKDNEYLVILLLEKPNGWASRQAEQFQKDHPGQVLIEMLGSAHSGRPEAVPPDGIVQEDVLRPGLSISHFSGLPGTLGCLVNYTKRGGDVVPGLISASHVLGNLNRARKGDRVLHPGNTDIVPKEEYVVGHLRDYVLLSHYSDSTDEAHGLGNRFDAAVAEIDDENQVGENLVPDPNKPDEGTIPVRKAVPSDEMYDLIGQDVFKNGRTSGFTRGVLQFALVTRQPITLPDRQIYIFRDVIVVHSTDPQRPFSQPGDSGSMAYTGDGRGIGLIIGGNDKFSLLSPLDASLREMKAELYV